MIEIHQRKSHTSIKKIYFWTSTIHKWLPLLENDFNKQVIVDSFKYLSDKELVTVYAFVIMPNHIHLIWRQNGLNGRETPKGSLLKHTAHLFLKHSPWFVSHEPISLASVRGTRNESET